MKRVFCDIDGTLTKDPRRGGEPRPDTINLLKDLIRRGYMVVLWSAGGTRYAKTFARKHGIRARTCIGKPDWIIDDKPGIRTPGHLTILSPEKFLSQKFPDVRKAKKGES